jgi:thiol-disulfide isomerase/thioredoxin
MRKVLCSAVLAVGCVFGYAAEAPARAKLMVGDRAPALEVAKWIQGEPVKKFEKDKAYIVEFWASWCAPCKVSIPHLNAIHEKFKDKGLVVIGMDIREDEAADGVTFVKQMGKQMAYRIGQDEVSAAKGKMDETWMEAAEADGIPTAFLVNQEGLLAWIGHPMELKDGMIEDVLAKRYDVKAAAAKYVRKRENAVKIKELEAAFETAMEAKDWAKAEQALASQEALIEEEDRPSLNLMRLMVKIRKGNLAEAEKVARELEAQKSDNARFFDGLAWTIATENGVSASLLDIAEKAATKADAMEHGKDASILETLARVRFMKGDKAGAIATQEKAIKALPATESERMRKRYEMALDAYRAGQLPK